MKVADAIGAQLDWMVAKCEGIEWEKGDLDAKEYGPGFKPSTDWSLGGPIIEREEIGLKRNAPCSDGRQWEASPSITAKGAGGKYGYGPTPLIAAMRCFCASRLGEEVEVPDELAR